MRHGFTAGDVFDREVPRLLAENPGIAKKINAVLAIDIAGENGGYWTLDLRETPVVERGRTKEPKCTLSTHVDEFESLMAGGSIRAVLEAFKAKRIQATGHLPTIIKLEGLIMPFVRRTGP